jgi:hypothetical protein
MRTVIRVTNGLIYHELGYKLVQADAGCYKFVNIAHCSCEGTDNGDEDACDLTLEDVVRLAKAGADPRVPDVTTTNLFLRKLYELILLYADRIPSLQSDKIYMEAALEDEVEYTVFVPTKAATYTWEIRFWKACAGGYELASSSAQHP